MNLNTFSPGDAEAQFRDAIAAAGIAPPITIIADGQLHRYPTNGKPSDDAGFYVLHLDNIPAGYFGCHRAGIEQKWCAKPDKQLTETERAENQRRRQQAQQKAKAAKAEREAERKKAKAEAVKLWEAATEPKPDHAYLARKLVKPYGLRQHGDRLLIPARDSAGQLVSLQRIKPDGEKKYFPGTSPKPGGFHLIGEPGERVLVAEGYATGATLHEATGLAVAVAFDCGNLKPVAEAIRTQYPDAVIALASDDDAETDGNPGRAKAEDAARAVGGNIVLPDFGESRPSGVSDFNDLAAVAGLGAVRDQVSAAKPVEWPEPEPLAEAEKPQPYPLDALPGLIRDAVSEVVSFSQSPVPLAAASALSALSLAGQALADVQRAEGLTGPCSLFFLTLAESGERKTTIDGRFFDPFHAWEKQKADEAKPELQDFEAAQSAWEAQEAGLKQNVKRLTVKDAHGPELVEATDRLKQHQATKPERPRVPILMRVDATPEALGFGLTDEWPSAGIITAEGGSFFGSHGMGRDSIMRNLALQNTLWDGKPHKVSRRTSQSYTVRGARLTVGVQVQDAAFREFARQAPELARGMGFFARFLVSLPESTQGTRFFTEPPKGWPALSKYQDRLTDLLETPPILDDDHALCPPLLSLSDEGRQAWINFHDNVERELRPSGTFAEVRDVASKAADNVARLACLFHILDHGPTGSISADYVRAAGRVDAWHLSESRRFFDSVALPPELMRAVILDDWLIAKCRDSGQDNISTRDISRNAPPRIRRGEYRDAALELLAEAGRIRIETEGKQKRVRVNPRLLES